ncbi:uncharacterized protein HMPREF1541_10771 [Cyphellophora europaea CBS 101466]|uniref:NAD(P)-binding protein n=1 Tax=Cyphellophora europaea (strain CBS 101466) TaxID=1220924 RepID=W2S6G4_CYPE1|nr:uncharacterized protein HMPREF1541_10771 [Cyphellophora europaea CBS 101466]ETN44220.1 hypothetical protein HMPREF1541_10771 [Cyphellophora europaea CBS 101466]
MTFHPDSLPDLTGKVYVVTGGNAGIGYYTVARLAEHGAHVYLCARSPTKGNAAIDGIKALYPQAHITLLQIDHMSLSSVVAAARTLLKRESSLHGLVNNAGIMATPFEMTSDGYEAQWQTNYLAHWLFTSHLIPLMLKTSKSLSPGSVRIVNVSSGGHNMAPNGGIDLSDTALASSSPLTRYGQSKLANILHAKVLHKLYGPGSPSSKAGTGEIWTAVLHPGVVGTNLGDNAVWPFGVKTLFSWYTALGGPLDPDKGSWSSVFCVASPAMTKDQSGTYFLKFAKKGSESALAKDMELAARLEEWTKKELLAKDEWAPAGTGMKSS